MEHLHYLLINALWGFFILTLLMSLITIFLSRQLSHPFNTIIQSVKLIGEGKINLKELLIRDDEFSILARAMVATDKELYSKNRLIKEKEKRLLEAQKIAHVGHWELDLQHHILDVSSEIYEILEIKQEESLNLAKLLSYLSLHGRQKLLSIHKKCTPETPTFDIEHHIILPSHEIKYLLESGTVFFDKQGNPTKLKSTILNVTEKKKSELKILQQTHTLDHLAHYDSLTNLPNRLLMHDRLEQAIKKASRHKTFFAVLFIDLDGFKSINDRFGHDVGDKVLQLIANRFNSSIRKMDTLARIGGDEFVLIMDGLHHKNDPSNIAQKLIDTFHSPLEVNGHAFSLSSSIGIALYPQDGQESEILLHNADTVMYNVKKTGKNRYAYFDENMRKIADEKLFIEKKLQQAIKEESFSLYFQPLIDSQTKNISSIEALIRWEHPKLGLTDPLTLLSVQKNPVSSTLINIWALKQMKLAIKTLEDADLINVNININITAQQLLEKQYLDQLLNTVQNNPLSLSLNISEFTQITSIDTLTDILIQLQKSNIHINVNDFNFTQTHLQYLKLFSIQSLKIDTIFINNITKNSHDQAIVKSIITLAHDLDLKVVAKGVENKDQVNFLQDLDCDEMQGFYFYGEMSIKETIEKAKQALQR
jgi:diguanylate cyclase (GGDEF)-like protein